MTSATLFDSDEVTPDVNGLIFEVNSEELQALGETCTDAKSRAYCKKWPSILYFFEEKTEI